MLRLAFIMHGNIRGRDRLWARIERQFGARYAPKRFVTRRAGQARALSRQALDEGCTHLISVGGDGTLNEVINGLMDARRANDAMDPKHPRVGLLPMGTGNDFARSLNLSPDLRHLKALLDSGRYRAIDLGHARFHGPDGQARERCFINITDLGLGGEVVKRAATYHPWLGRSLNYQRAIFFTLLKYRAAAVRIQADAFDYEGKALALIIANGKYFGGGMGIAPHAKTDDGQLAIVVLGDVGIGDYLLHLRSLFLGRPLDHPKVVYRSAERLRVEALTGPLPIDLDGEFVGYSPLEVRVQPSAIRFIAD